jgi:hypothetical protein
MPIQYHCRSCFRVMAVCRWAVLPVFQRSLLSPSSGWSDYPVTLACCVWFIQQQQMERRIEKYAFKGLISFLRDWMSRMSRTEGNLHEMCRLRGQEWRREKNDRGGVGRGKTKWKWWGGIQIPLERARLDPVRWDELYEALHQDLLKHPLFPQNVDDDLPGWAKLITLFTTEILV